MREPLHGDRFDERIGDNDFFLAECSRVAIESGLGIGLKQFPDSRKAAQEFQSQIVGRSAQIPFVAPAASSPWFYASGGLKGE